MAISFLNHTNKRDCITEPETIFDFIIIGSGFGGAVSACRLTEKGYKVLLIEKGQEFNLNNTPKSNWNLKNYLWAPLIRCFGLQQLTFLNKLLILHGTGYGGGSLVYANTHVVPEDHVFKNSDLWPASFASAESRQKYYSLAKKMLGTTPNPVKTNADDQLFKLAQSFNKEKTFEMTHVGVYFNDNDLTEKDPYFNGAGPLRKPCNHCGACMVGCRNNSKNTLDKNYLYFAEKNGLQKLTNSYVTKIIPLQNSKNNKNYCVKISHTRNIFLKKEFFAKKVILAAGVIGTLELLFKSKIIKNKSLGSQVRTNGESLCGATAYDSTVDYSKGIAIGSAFQFNQKTKIEPVRYPLGSDLLKMLAVPLINEQNQFKRIIKTVLFLILNIVNLSRFYLLKDWAKSTIILLVMQTTDEKVKIKYKRFWLNFFKKSLVCEDKENTIRSNLPEAYSATFRLAEQIKGLPQNTFGESFFNIPATAHILGGCTMNKDSQFGLVDQNFKVHGHENLYIVDGSVIPENLGVNPSLTITALAECFSEQFKNKLD